MNDTDPQIWLLRNGNVCMTIAGHSKYVEFGPHESVDVAEPGYRYRYLDSVPEGARPMVVSE